MILALFRWDFCVSAVFVLSPAMENPGSFTIDVHFVTTWHQNALTINGFHCAGIRGESFCSCKQIVCQWDGLTKKVFAHVVCWGRSVINSFIAVEQTISQPLWEGQIHQTPLSHCFQIHWQTSAIQRKGTQRREFVPKKTSQVQKVFFAAHNVGRKPRTRMFGLHGWDLFPSNENITLNERRCPNGKAEIYWFPNFSSLGDKLQWSHVSEHVIMQILFLWSTVKFRVGWSLWNETKARANEDSLFLLAKAVFQAIRACT